MRIINATYLKEDSQRDVKLYKLQGNNSYIEGIDLTKLNDEEKKELKNVVDEYWIKLKPFFTKSYRRFSMVNFIINNEEEI